MDTSTGIEISVVVPLLSSIVISVWGQNSDLLLAIKMWKLPKTTLVANDEKGQVHYAHPSSKDEENTYTELQVYKGYDKESLEDVLEQQSMLIDRFVNVINDVDKKAAQTLRLNILLLSLMIGILSFSSNKEYNILNQLSNIALFTGIIGTISSVIASLIAYSRTNIAAGLSSESTDVLFSEPLKRKEVLYSLIISHQDWINTNARVNQTDSSIVFISHILLLLSVFNYLLAVSWVAYPHIKQAYPKSTQVVVISVAGVLALLGPYYLLNRRG
ncbi:hypothetical protein [Haladaptatus sp. CMAA 1911]|uniref:hypothetical protein n=1 Tax=unclassified Haladaptatus TaxID=2622732 RepID=UPI003753FF44